MKEPRTIHELLEYAISLKEVNRAFPTESHLDKRFIFLTNAICQMVYRANNDSIS